MSQLKYFVFSTDALLDFKQVKSSLNKLYDCL